MHENARKYEFAPGWKKCDGSYKFGPHYKREYHRAEWNRNESNRQTETTSKTWTHKNNNPRHLKRMVHQATIIRRKTNWNKVIGKIYVYGRNEQTV